MRTAAALLLLCSLALPAGARERRQAFRVGAVVVRSGTVHAGPSRLRLSGRDVAAVSIDAAPPLLTKGDVALPPGTTRVTIQY